MTTFVKTARHQWMLVALVILALGIALQFALLIPALGRISAQAEAGEQAKARQCQLAPVSRRMFTHAADARWITRADLALVVGEMPRHCP